MLLGPVYYDIVYLLAHKRLLLNWDCGFLISLIVSVSLGKDGSLCIGSAGEETAGLLRGLLKWEAPQSCLCVLLHALLIRIAACNSMVAWGILHHAGMATQHARQWNMQHNMDCLHTT